MRAGTSRTEARAECAAVMYAVNILGVRGPRKMTALVPAPPQVRWRLADAFRFASVTLSCPLLPPLLP